MYLPNHFLFGATRATSPEATELWKGAGFTIFPFLFLKEKSQRKNLCGVKKKKNTNYIKGNVKRYAWWCKKILEWILGKDLLFNPLTPISDKGRISPYYVYNTKQTNDENKEKY